jgi:hypothetical protein
MRAVSPPPTAADQVRSIQRQNLKTSLFVLPFLGAGLAAALLLSGAIRQHLGEGLYRPSCVVACRPAGGARGSFSPGGRGHPGQVFCSCVEGARRAADLSSGPALDQALHWGLEELLCGLAFAAPSLLGLGLARRVLRYP